MKSPRIVAARIYWATRTARERALIILACGLLLSAAGMATFHVTKTTLVSAPDGRLVARGEVLASAPLARRVSASTDFMHALEDWRDFARSTLRTAARGEACHSVRSLEALVARAKAARSSLQQALGRLTSLESSGSRADLTYAITGLEVDLRAAERVLRRMPPAACA